MRLHITLDAAIVEELDRRVGLRARSAFIATAVKAALDDARRWDDIEAALGSLAAHGHAWDEDPAEWVRHERSSDARRTG